MMYLYMNNYFEFAQLRPINEFVAQVGVLIGVFFLVGLYWVHCEMGDSWSGIVTEQKNHILCTGGPFRLARHPLYTSSLMQIVAIVLISQNLILPLTSAILMIYGSSRINREEQLMIELFGEQYVAYKGRVGAFWPWKPFGRDFGLNEKECEEALSRRQEEMSKHRKTE